ncbi:MAG: ABC transporter permease [Ruminococcaceae bacterium]|nr:ABC transporter permease [Oscillospiraceae bacterium]
MISKREKFFDIARSASAIALAMGVAFALILLTSKMPGEAIKSLIVTPFSTKRYVWRILERMVPLVFTGLAVCIMFSSNQFNLAGEGAFFAGGMTGASVAIYMNLPFGLHPVVAVIFAGLVGAIIMLLVSILSVKLGANMLVISLMVNYVILQFGTHINTYVIRDPQWGGNGSYLMQKSALIPPIKYTTSYGLIFAVLMIVVVGLYIYHTKWGYSVRMIGANISFAQYSGIKVDSVIISSQLIGGAIAAMGGAVEVLGFYKRFEWNALPGYGWTGVTIAILAGNNPWKVPLAAFFLAYLEVGSGLMQINADIQPEMLDIIKAIIFLFFAAKNFLAPLRQKLVVKAALSELNENKSVEAEV